MVFRLMNLRLDRWKYRVHDRCIVLAETYGDAAYTTRASTLYAQVPSTRTVLSRINKLESRAPSFAESMNCEAAGSAFPPAICIMRGYAVVL